jgi:hypothetical protein
MKTQLSGDEGRVGEWAWSHLAGIGVGGWNSSSGCRRFPVFWQEGMDLVFSSVKTIRDEKTCLSSKVEP